MTSYEAQKTYYTDKIMQNPQWSTAGIFADGLQQLLFIWR